MIPLHVAAGLLALLSGAVALYALKGGALHRKSGMVFVYAMLVMSASGAVIAALQPTVVAMNVIAGALTFYLVLTALLTVRRPVLEFRWTDGVPMLVALAVCLACLKLGTDAVGGERRNGPLPVFVMFGGVALLATVGDLRLMLGRRVDGRPRIARHLWRMCFALFIAAASFFLGPPQRLPAPLRESALRPVPVLLVLLVMAYWMVRVRVGRRPPLQFRA
jgi:hypothetical protein